MRTPEEIIAEWCGGMTSSDRDKTWIAREMVKALDAAGYVIVPKEPTDFMAQHGANGYLGMDDSVAADIWQRMIRAAKP